MGRESDFRPDIAYMRECANFTHTLLIKLLDKLFSAEVTLEIVYINWFVRSLFLCSVNLFWIGQVWKLSLYHQFGAVKFTLSNKKIVTVFYSFYARLVKEKLIHLFAQLNSEWNANSIAMRENRQIRCIEDETKNKWRKLSNGETGGFRSFCPGSNLSTAIATVLSKITKKSATMEEKRKKIPVASRNV